MRNFENSEIFVGKGNYDEVADYLEENDLVLPRNIRRQVHLG